MASAMEGLAKNKLNYLDRNILNYLYKNPKLGDMVFIVNDQIFPANKCVVSGASDVFEAMLFGSFQESSATQIRISDVTNAENFSYLLSYIYGFGIQVDSLTLEDILEVLKLGHRYKIPKVCETLQAYVSKLELEATSEYSFGTSAFMELLNNAYTYNINELYDSMKFIIKSTPKNVHKFLEHPKLVEIKCPVLIDVFEADNFCTEEVKILGSVLKWLDANVCDIEDDSGVSNEEAAKSSTVSDSDSGIELSCFFQSLIKGDEIESNSVVKPNGISDDSNFCTSGGKSTEDNAGKNDTNDFDNSKYGITDFERLLKTVRFARFNVPDMFTMWKKYAHLFKKYENIMATLMYGSGYCVKYNTRVPFSGTRIQLTECYNITRPKLSVQSALEQIKLRLSVSHNKTYNKVVVTLLANELNNCSCSKNEYHMDYTLKLSTSNPFEASKIVALRTKVQYPPKELKTIQHACPHACTQYRCYYRCNHVQDVDEYVLNNLSLPVPEVFEANDQNSYVSLEAFIEVIPQNGIE